MNISNYLNATAKIDAEWNGEGFSFTYRTHGLSPEVLETLRRVSDNALEMAKALSSLITEWTITLDNDAEFPPTFENLQTLPIEFLSYLLEKISEVWQGNAPAPSKSASGSAVKAE